MISEAFLRSDVDIAAQRVSLTGFRNYAHLDLELHSGFNVIAGPNAQGKTNLLESIYLISTTRLLRGQRDAEAILEGEMRAQVHIELAPHDTKLSMTLEKGVRKRAAVNGLNLPRASDLLGRLPCVCVSTFDLEIVRGDPSERRMFLDLELSSLFPAYLRHLTLYKRALDQRNALLKDCREWMQPDAVFEIWEDQLADHGCAIRELRMRYVERLEPAVQEIHSWMGAGETISLTYLAKDDCLDPDSTRRTMAATRRSDVHRGSTTIGPHRDDIGIEVDGREARLFGSQGQQRTAVIALKFGTLEIARDELGVAPMLLLDDMLSDLDRDRRTLLIEVVLAKSNQALLTCTEPDVAGESILSQAKVFHVLNGRIESR